MVNMILNSLPIIKYLNELKVIETDIQYVQLNKILGSYHDICYHLYAGKLYFLGDEDVVITTLKASGFKADRFLFITINLLEDWEIIRPILYKSLKYYFINQDFIWKDKRRNQIFILKPLYFNRTQLVNEIYNESFEKLIVYEGFRYWLEFIDEALVLTLLPKVKPVLPLDSKMAPEKLRVQRKKFLDVPSPIMRKKGFSREFRKIALKPNYKKREVLNAIVKLLSNNDKKIVVPTGNLKEGLILSSKFITLNGIRVGFYEG